MSQLPNDHVQRAAGGSAAAGGVVFQASVVAVALVYMARGRPLHWLDGVVDDTPVFVAAETGGPGDDVHLHFRAGARAEVQVKQGLQTGDRLWSALQNLADGIDRGLIDYGVLAVSPDSSRTITHDLARDIQRLGDGRSDGLSEIGERFRERLVVQRPLNEVCKRIRIVEAHASSADGVWMNMARAELAHVCRDQNQTDLAWQCLFGDATNLMKRRGARSAPDVVRVLCASGIAIAGTDQSPVAVLTKILAWTKAANASYSIFGLPDALPLDSAWLPVKATAIDDVPDADGLADALKHYHAPAERRGGKRDLYDAETTGRFFRGTVVVGGPGMGKTTLLRKIALSLAGEGQPALGVKLSAIAARMRSHGASFHECLFELGLDGAPVTPATVRSAAIPGWVLLCDGLDECGGEQENVLEGLARFISGHPDCRAIVTTRPIGYRSARLADWRHYELTPLDKANAHAHLTQLIECVTEEGPRRAEAVSVAKTFLSRDGLSDVVVRSPLMLGMAASLFLRGRPIGPSRVDLFCQIFELIDEAPNARISPIGTMPAPRLRRFLDVLGWDLISHPLSRTDEIVSRCGALLGTETNELGIVARETAEACVRYWQQVGLIERVRHDGDDTLTFVHLTFAEYAAARYLATLSTDEQRRAVADNYNKAGWAEVLGFAAAMGLSTFVAEAVLANALDGPARFDAAERLLNLLSSGDNPPEPSTRGAIFDLAAACIQSERRARACAVGAALYAIVARFGNEIAPRVAPLRVHPNDWTQIIAWACLAKAGALNVPLAELKAAMLALPSVSTAKVSGSLADGMRVIAGDRRLAEDFLVSGARVLLERAPDDADAIIPEAMRRAGSGSWMYYQDIKALLDQYGKRCDLSAVGGWEDLGRRGANIDFTSWGVAQKEAFQRLMAAIAEAGVGVSDASDCETAPARMYCLAAFLKVSGFWELPGNDVWAWDKGHNPAAVAEAMRAMIAASKIPPDVLGMEARAFQSVLETAEADSMAPFIDLPSIDTPELDWSVLKACAPDLSKLETALHHKSPWVVEAAAQAIEGAGQPPGALRELICRLLNNGRGYALWAAWALANEIAPDDARELIVERLKRPLVEGCEFLFEALRDDRPDYLPLDVLSNGLMSSTAIAIAAAKAARAHATAERDELGALLAKAFAYWLQHEEPYPKQGGVIPPSPRDLILEAMFAIEPAGDAALFSYLKDDRSDVRDVAKKAIAERLGRSEAFRSALVERVLSGSLDPAILRDALAQKVRFAPADVERIVELLRHADPRHRYAALNILDKTYLPPDRISELAHAATSDGEQELRDAAFRVLDAKK